MFGYNLKFLTPFLLLFSLLSCKQPRADRTIERSIYYWKSIFSLSNFEQQRLNSLHIKTIYLKCFDVAWNEMQQLPLPVAVVKIADSNYLKRDSIKIIPVVFITNESLVKIDSSKIAALGENIITLIKKIIGENNFTSVPEVQIDCDWTTTTKEKYFMLLRSIKKLKPNAILSATIRLYQLKYVSKTGIPPVDKGLLMCYNMGNLKNPATKNSIIETGELKKYTGALQNYPLSLDVALPLFDWHVLFRNNIYSGLLNDMPDSIIDNNPAIKKAGNRYEIQQDTVLSGYAFKKGDILRSEKSNYKELLAAAEIINSKLPAAHLKLSLFHLDSLTLSKYSTYELESIYNSLR